MASERPCWTLTIPSDLCMLSVVRVFVEAICQSHKLDSRVQNAVLIAVCEAASNTIRHAHRDRPQAQLHLECAVGTNQLEIRLRDEGEPFDLTQVPNLPPGEMRLGGRGVFLMRTLMDELSYAPATPRGNVLRMVKRWLASESIRDVG